MHETHTTENTATISILNLGHDDRDILLREIANLHKDIQLITAFVQDKLDKRARKKERKLARRLAEERRLREIEKARFYKSLVWYLRVRPWNFMPMPKNSFTLMELKVTELLARGQSDTEIAQKLNLKENSIPARICAINKRLKLRSRSELIEHYRNEFKERKKQRRRRCLTILYWLLNPPANPLNGSCINAPWEKGLGKSKWFRYVDLYISNEALERLSSQQMTALKLRLKGFDDEQIAERLKVRRQAVRSYFSEIRSTIHAVSAVKLASSEALVERFQRHPYFKTSKNQKTS